jgi:thioredoxin reductase (NADPH)
MAKPIILSVDDEPEVLAAVVRDLRKHFGKEYRIMKAGGGEEALQTAKDLAERGSTVAAMVSDQRMPGVTGTEWLGKAREFHPDAKRVLLTAYADTEAAIESINSIGLDYYLMKPWDPPEQNLYPVLDDLLSDWKANTKPAFEGIRVAGTLWSPHSHDVKDFLSRNHIHYRWLDVENDEKAREMVETAQPEGQHKLPVVFFPDGEKLVAPELPALAEKIGLKTTADDPYYDVVIVGGGPAGLAAAVYAGSEGLKTVMVEKKAPGGQAGTSSFIENYLGFPKGITGADLARRALTQAKRLGVEILSGEVTGVATDDVHRKVTLKDGGELSCKVVILASGVTVRTLTQPGIDELTGKGVYYGASLTEAALYKDQPMVVAGAANSAGQGALFFARYGKKVTMLVRRDSMAHTMSHYLIEQIKAVPNIEVLTHTEIKEAHGDEKLEALTLVNNRSQEENKIDCSALFAFIGAKAHTDLVADLVERDENGFVLTGSDLMKSGRPEKWPLDRDPLPMETSVPGIFAAGDVRSGSIKRVATAVGEGANAVSVVHQYLKTV